MGKGKKIKAGELYQYDAFISYRHCAPDSMVAAELHKQLEAYKMPSNIEASLDNGHKSIERVFRDEEELPVAVSLEDSIVTALENSEWLIVICSPRLVESEWCRLEIKTFIELHGRDHILAVLVEGEPETSFPPELVYEEYKHLDSDGNTVTERRYVEPLAADVRGKNKKEIKKNIESIKLRLIAAMFRLNYDDLRQRHREKVFRRRLGFMVGIAVAAILVGSASFITMLQIKNQKDQIQRQNEEIAAQNEQLLINRGISEAERSLSLLSQGNRTEAIRTSYDALTTLDELQMPYTPEAEYALSSSLYVYETQGGYLPFDSKSMPNNVCAMELSPEGSYLATVDKANNIYVWDSSSMYLMGAVTKVVPYSEAQKNYLWLSDTKLLVLRTEKYEEGDGTGTAYVIDCTNFSRTKLYNPVEVEVSDLVYDYCVSLSPDRSTFIVYSLNGYVNVYNTSTCELISSYILSQETSAVNASFLPEDAEATELTDAGFRNCEYVSASDGYVVVGYSSNNEKCYVRICDSATMDVRKNYCIPGQNVVYTKILNGIMYIVSMDMSDFTNIQENVMAVDINSDQLIWMNELHNYSSEVFMFVVGGQAYMNISFNNRMVIYNLVTGAICGDVSLSGEIVKTYTYDSGLIVYTSEGYKYFVSIDAEGGFYNAIGAPMATDFYSDIECLSVNFRNDYYFAARRNTNSILMFRNLNCPDMENYTESGAVGYSYEDTEGLLEEPDCIGINYNCGSSENADTCTPYLDDFQVGNRESISSIVISGDGLYLFVNRIDFTFDIYTEDGLLGSFSEVGGSWVQSYLGTDSDGNIYIKNDCANNGYKISPEGRLIAVIDQLVGLDADENRIIRQVRDSFFSQPIYSLDDLLEMARDYLGIEE